MIRILRLYAASPLGFSETGKLFYQKEFIPRVLDAGFEVIDPWTLTDQSLINTALQMPYGVKQKKRWQEINPIIGQNNADGIDRSDIVGAVLDGTDVDSGTASEIGYAAARGIPVIGYRGDFRLSADNVGSTVNLQVEYFIRLHGGEITTTIDDFYDALVRQRRRLLGEK